MQSGGVLSVARVQFVLRNVSSALMESGGVFAVSRASAVVVVLRHRAVLPLGREGVDVLVLRAASDREGHHRLDHPGPRDARARAAQKETHSSEVCMARKVPVNGVWTSFLMIQ